MLFEDDCKYHCHLDEQDFHGNESHEEDVVQNIQG